MQQQSGDALEGDAQDGDAQDAVGIGSDDAQGPL